MNPYLPCSAGSGRAAARIRLFCLPYACAGAGPTVSGGAGPALFSPVSVNGPAGPLRDVDGPAVLPGPVTGHDSLRTEVVTVRGEPRQRLGPRPRLVVTERPGLTEEGPAPGVS
ncbi:MAG: hypothetical protein ACLQDY_29300 [Streptosporangiaceae bacterium]